MRQTISGLVAAVAVMAVSAVPALACGGTPCAQTYVAPVASCYSCGWAHERLPDPVHQYYYVEQGPTYSGPGDWAPVRTYQEGAVPVWGAYHHPYHHGYYGGRYANVVTHEYDGAGEGPAVYSYRAHRHFRPWHHHHSMRYGVSPRHYGYGHVLRRYY
jgi:hypothetical protein